MQKKIQEKQEKHKNKMIQNEIGILSARTRISRINTQYVYNIQNSYKLKLLEDQINSAKKIDEFKVSKKNSYKLQKQVTDSNKSSIDSFITQINI